MDFNDSPEEAAWRAECREWLEANAPSVAGPATDENTMFETGGPDYLERARRWQALKFDAGFARITWEPEFGGRNGTTMQQMIFGQEEARFDVPNDRLRDRSRDDRPDAARVWHRGPARALPHEAAPRRRDLVASCSASRAPAPTSRRSP